MTTETSRPPWLRALATYGPLAWFVSVLGVWVMSLLATPFDRGYTAGEMHDHLLSWQETGVLYPALDQVPLRVLNYPPLFFALVRGATVFGLSPLLAARIGTLMALIVCVMVVYRWLLCAGTSRGGAIAVTGLLGASFGVLHAAGQFRVELPAVALTMVGLYLLVAPERRRNVAVAGALLALACFTKQTQVVFPVIAVVWLWVYHRHRVLAFVGGFAIAAVAGLLVTWWAFGPEMWRHILTYTVGTFAFSQFMFQFNSFVLPWCVFVAIAIWLGVTQPALRRDMRWWYLAGSSIWIFAAARNGSSSNYFIDWGIATLLVIGPWFGEWLVGHGRRLRPVVALAHVLQVIGASVGAGVAIFINVAGLLETRAALPAMCGAIPEDQMVVPMESPGLARACGRVPALHPFIISNLAARGLWDEKPFVHALSGGEFPVVILPFDPSAAPQEAHTDRWTSAMVEAIATNYVSVAREAGWVALRYRAAN